MSALPVIGIFFKKIHGWYHKRTHHKCHQAGCSDEHAEHPTIPPIENITIPPNCHQLTIEEVDVRFGIIATTLLVYDRKLLGVKDFPPPAQFTWFVNPDNHLFANWGAKVFTFITNDWQLVFDETSKVSENSLDVSAQFIRLLLEDLTTYRSVHGGEKSANEMEAEKFLESLTMSITTSTRLVACK